MHGSCHSHAAPLYLVLIAVLLTASASAFATSLNSTWVDKPHKPVARFDSFWQEERDAVRLDNGWMFARNDKDQLYLLIDLTGDTVDNKPMSTPPWGDFVSVVFDVDRNGVISANKDLRYGEYPGTYRLGRQQYIGMDRFSGLQPTQALLAVAFSGTSIMRQKHRIWEFSIPLKEIEATPGGRVLLGIETYSEQPRFDDKLPTRHMQELKGLIEIYLARNPSNNFLAKMNFQDLRKMVSEQRIVVRPKNELHPQLGSSGGLHTPPATNQPPHCPLPEGEPIKRAILDDGTIELSYANGSKKMNFHGGWKILCPDGTPVPTATLRSTQIPPTEPPILPNEVDMRWFEYQDMRLMGIISMLVKDQGMVDKYLENEPQYWNIYQRIQHHSETISQLLAE